MNEAQLSIKFSLFLQEQLGYPKESLLLELPVTRPDGARMHVDLAVLDLNSSEYIGLIEFKSSLTENNLLSALKQVKVYQQAMGLIDVPTYLVTNGVDDSFEIYVLEDYGPWIPIATSTFPSYKTLSARKKAKDKANQNKEEENKYKRKQYLSLWTLSSAVLGILVSVFSVVYLGSADFLL